MKKRKKKAGAQKAPKSNSPKEGRQKVIQRSMYSQVRWKSPEQLDADAATLGDVVVGWVIRQAPCSSVLSPFPGGFFGTEQEMREEEERLRDLLGKGDYEGYLITFDGHERLEPFLKICEEMPDADYWKCLAFVWDNIEISFPDRHKWLALFESTRPGRSHLMSEDDWKTLAGLPDTFTVFRGYAKGRVRSGLSWTLSEERAHFFAAECATGLRRAMFCGYKPGGPGMLASGRCRKQDVLAYFNGRNEEEIVIRPENVFAKRSREIQRLEPYLKEIRGPSGKSKKW